MDENGIVINVGSDTNSYAAKKLNITFDTKVANLQYEQATINAQNAAETATTATDAANSAATSANTAADAANTAAALANQKATVAQTATDAAITATANADTATDAATTAANTAITATANADTATDAATTAANTAITAADTAITAADTANNAVHDAETAIANAETATQNATTAAETATTAANVATAAATDATTATTNANTAATAANNAANNAAAAETTRISNENTRVTNESTRVENENGRVESEQARIDGEQMRVYREETRATKDDDRDLKESRRQLAENERDINEQTRTGLENLRQSSDADRLTAESQRDTNEATRVSNENTRVSNEQARVTAEAGRQAALDGKLDKASVKQVIGTSTTDVMSQKAVTDAIANAISNDLWYGVEWDSAVSSPNGTRIGNPTLHRTLPVHNMLKGVLLADDGTENLVLPDNSWIGQTLDGSMGQVMVKIPNYYFKCEQDGTKFRFKISTTKLAGYSTFFDESIPYVYCSAYEAGLDRTNLKLTSIVNSSTQYRGGNNNSSWDGTYRSLLNIPATSINRINFRTYARNRNTNNTYWNEYIYTIHVMISWLFYTEYATLNSQKDYNAQLDSNGYKQGGLGKGVSDISDWGGYNGYNPFIPNGISDSLGNNSGVVNYNVIASDGSSTYYVAQVPRYRGIQNPFGHLHKWSDGINIKEDGTTRTAYVTTHPSKFSDTAYDGYENRGTTSHSADFATRMLFGAFGDLMPTNVGGSSSTFWCDYYWLNTTPNLYGALLGGSAADGAYDGFGCVDTPLVPSDAYTLIGSRLCFVKES